ncbi:hypothetical protein SBDP1_290029 [Syntrophobacter sp. SbD1]|nr:hypothetical protein SBDP1_290029 [Syntrophobacter sp. SbD1]
MADKPSAALKDLCSTGYFYDELKKYTASKEMDISTYCINFAVPYLAGLSTSYDRPGHVDESNIFRLAVNHLSEISDEDLVESIFGLKKVSLSELDKLGKAAHLGQLDKSEVLSHRRKRESAESLIKLLVNIIKTFKLAEVTAKQRKSEGISDPVGDAIMQTWEIQNGPHIDIPSKSN